MGTAPTNTHTHTHTHTLTAYPHGAALHTLNHWQGSCSEGSHMTVSVCAVCVCRLHSELAAAQSTAWPRMQPLTPFELRLLQQPASLRRHVEAMNSSAATLQRQGQLLSGAQLFYKVGEVIHIHARTDTHSLLGSLSVVPICRCFSCVCVCVCVCTVGCQCAGPRGCGVRRDKQRSSDTTIHHHDQHTGESCHSPCRYVRDRRMPTMYVGNTTRSE